MIYDRGKRRKKRKEEKKREERKSTICIRMFHPLSHIVLPFVLTFPDERRKRRGQYNQLLDEKSGDSMIKLILSREKTFY